MTDINTHHVFLSRPEIQQHELYRITVNSTGILKTLKCSLFISNLESTFERRSRTITAKA